MCVCVCVCVCAYVCVLCVYCVCMCVRVTLVEELQAALIPCRAKTACKDGWVGIEAMGIYYPFPCYDL